jgi:hypothetical protein
MSYQALHLSPIIPSTNIRITSGFFTEVLQFKTGRDDQHHKILYKDNLTIHICRAGTDIGEMAVYLEVDDVDRIWADIQDKVRGLRVKEPFDRDYGMREAHIIVPETQTLLFIGHVISTPRQV